MSAFERPAPDLSKIIAAWRTWQDDDQALPGRTMADLKIGGTDRMLATLAADNPDPIAPVVEAWNSWERGRTGPQQTLDALGEVGFDDIIGALAEPA